MRRDREQAAIPEQFIERLREELSQAECDALCEALCGDAPTSVRFNPYKKSTPPEGLEPIAWSRYGFYLAQRPSFTMDAEFHAGTYYVQEASSQFVGHILSFGDFDGARVVDMCAAPGGKTTLYSTLVGTSGLVLANEINRQRAAVLADNVRRWGLGNVVVSNGDSTHVAKFEAWGDVVAVDAPCSGEGMFRKNIPSREEWSEGNVMLCVKRQREILRDAWRALKPSGVLIYSTCTFNRDENEGVVSDFVAEFSEEIAPFESVECDPEWGVESSRVGDFQCFRFFPHRVKGEGFFVAVARKRFDVGGRSVIPKARKSIFTPVDKRTNVELAKWVEQGLSMEFRGVNDTIYGYYAWHVEAVRQLAESLTVIYSGVAMGQMFKGVLKPDAALALFCGLRRDPQGEASLEREDILCYLRREDVSAELFPRQGINLVCTQRGYAVGWVKRIGNRVNNLYPLSMRILKKDL